MKHKFTKPSTQELVLKSVLAHSNKHKQWPAQIKLHPAHVPYASLLLSLSEVVAIADSQVGAEEAVTV